MTTQADVDAVQAEYLRLISGRATSVVIDRDGQRVEFHRGNERALAALLATLQSQVTTHPGPMRVLL